MKRARVIPSLLINSQSMEKTQKFMDPIYLGDPMMAVRIWNDLQVDELIITDYTTERPDFDFLKELASEAFMPLVYGGGIKDAYDVEKIIKMGFEKITLNRINFLNDEKAIEIIKQFGSSAVIASVDIKKNFIGKYSIFSKSNLPPKHKKVLDYCQYIESLGYGEILLNLVDLEATFEGPDYEIASDISKFIDIPTLYQGGVSSKDEIEQLLIESKVSGVVCGGFFVLNGKLRTPLISYLEPKEIEDISISMSKANQK
tara:strand:- start:3025 stop:3798 length:774 start_codon:yes stop_codon:yes gene_type:complete